MGFPSEEKQPPLEPMSCRLLDYWSARRGDAALPRRAAIDLVCDLPALVAHCLLIEVGEGPSFRYRVVGTALADRARRDATGKMVSKEIYGDHLDDVLRPLCAVVETRRPVRVRGVERGIKMSSTPIEFVCVPIADDESDRVAFALGVISFLDVHIERDDNDLWFDALTTEIL
ncbi:PAS domain-containing protein [Roseiterribacter gracilis]|uniref:PAS domain-containing protein n=1 Tax=Roseiterribacter gracilis TaxID=2812848 RepID=A0A8S8XBG0_9PROT|nr:hypothetical protein TMPK1_11960 [Rhodospirillales bacterium TMPK1]